VLVCRQCVWLCVGAVGPSLVLSGSTRVLHQLGKGSIRHQVSGSQGLLTTQSVDSQNGVHMDAAVALIREARRVILATRGALS